MKPNHDQPSGRANALLWGVQILLALLFLFAGVMKLALPAAALAPQSPLPVGFLRFIGVCESLGALGLVLPGALRLHRELTPVAAAGLVVIMAGAVTVTALAGPPAPALFPLGVGILAAVLVRGRAGWLAAGRARQPALASSSSPTV